jgi:hypothetical protein
MDRDATETPPAERRRQLTMLLSLAAERAIAYLDQIDSKLATCAVILPTYLHCARLAPRGSRSIARPARSAASV